MKDLVERLRAELGPGLRTDPEVLAAHRRDTWVLSELRDLRGEPPPDPAAVAEPASTEEAAAVLRICDEAGAPVIPFGGGSGVCGGIEGRPDAVVVSTRRLRGLRGLAEEDLLARFGSGTGGMEAERELEARGLTLGHWPQSIELSTVGGWVATRASGQFSTAYGSIEDLVAALEVVLAGGRVLRLGRGPRSATGPDLRQLFLGSEGTLGLVTEVEFSLRRLPELRLPQAFHFESLPAGLPAVREVLQAGLVPPVVRLYDPPESARHFPAWCPEGRAMLILLHEGPEGPTRAAADAAARLLRAGGGAEADAAAVEHWLEHRNRVPGFRGFLERRIILDTIEVACAWSRVAELYRRVLDALAPVPGLLVASAHSSHSYRSGTNLYFTFAVRPEDPEDMARLYRECWERTLAETLAVGGTVSHHHGIGRVRREALARELGGEGVAVLRGLKELLDPRGILNPGVLIPD